MTIEPVGYMLVYPGCVTGHFESQFSVIAGMATDGSRPPGSAIVSVYTAEQVKALEAAAWEQGRMASAEAVTDDADASDFAIRALPNPHKHGSE